MRYYSPDRNLVVVYDIKNKGIGNVFIGKTLTAIENRRYTDNQIINFIQSAISKFETDGCDYLITDPPTYNPLFGKYLIMAKSDSCRVFLGRSELSLSNLRVSLINYLNPKIVDNNTQFCKIKDEGSMLRLPMQFSWGLNGNNPISPFRWMEFDRFSKIVTNITFQKPESVFCQLTNHFWPGDENVFDIFIGPNNKIKARRK